jgi:hypothetical protein
VGAILKRIGPVVIVLDLLIAGVASAALHHSPGKHNVTAGKMSAGQLEQAVEQATGAVRTTCTADPMAGWDYYCTSSDGSRTLYDVSAGQILQRSDLPSYR